MLVKPGREAQGNFVEKYIRYRKNNKY